MLCLCYLEVIFIVKMCMESSVALHSAAERSTMASPRPGGTAGAWSGGISHPVVWGGALLDPPLDTRGDWEDRRRYTG